MKRVPRTSPGYYHLDRIRDIVTRSRAEQGLPPGIVDELTLRQVAAVFRLAESGGASSDAA